MLLDTHALVWLALDPEQLSKKAGQAIDQAVKDGQPLLVCAASFWELARKISKGTLDLGMSAQTFLANCAKVSQFAILETTPEIWIQSAEMEWDHRDPIDRLLVATAETHDVPLVTCDKIIGRYYKSCVW